MKDIGPELLHNHEVCYLLNHPKVREVCGWEIQVGFNVQVFPSKILNSTRITNNGFLIPPDSMKDPVINLNYTFECDG